MIIKWGKITENVISAVMIGVIAGACTIVWKGATTVDVRVKASEEKLQSTIKVLSGITQILGEKMDNVELALKELKEESIERDDQEQKSIGMILSDVRSMIKEAFDRAKKEGINNDDGTLLGNGDADEGFPIIVEGDSPRSGFNGIPPLWYPELGSNWIIHEDKYYENIAQQIEDAQQVEQPAQPRD